ncbi:MAG: SDR family oxidoreductase [Kangiellaceae bacterium]|nr:SDR family oxidoreductase [Kangiellaceae bacterium]
MPVALITGAAIRVGKAIALQLAKDGYDIALHYNGSEEQAQDTAQQIQQLGREVVLIASDLSQLEHADELIEQASALGELTILVNSAAIFPENDTINDDLSHWDSVMNINLKAPLLLSQAFAGAVNKNNYQAHIINILDARINKPAGDHLIYRLSKSGLWHLTESLARELAPNIQVNGLALGAIMPPPGASDDHFQRMASKIPLQRTGQATDVAHAVSFLVQQNFITGAILPIDGGEFL